MISDRLAELSSFVVDNPVTFFARIVSDPGFVTIVGPFVLTFIFQHLRKGIAKDDPVGPEFDAAEPFINLSVHVASLVFGILIFTFINLKTIVLTDKKVWGYIYQVITIIIWIYCGGGLYWRFFLKTKHIGVYKKIPSQQIVAPWNIPFTYYRTGFAVLSWFSTIALMMYENI